MPITFGSADHSSKPIKDTLEEQLMAIGRRKRKAKLNKTRARSGGSSLEDLLRRQSASPGVQSN